MRSGSQFRVSGFHDPASPEFAEEFDTIRRIGSAQSTTRTDEESEIALFWEDGPWGLTPPGHFICVAMQLLQDRELRFIELARAFALVGMTQCDASICAWDNKYHYDIVRPESAIRARAPAFGNPDPRVVREPGLAQLHSDTRVPLLHLRPFHVRRSRRGDDRADPRPR